MATVAFLKPEDGPMAMGGYDAIAELMDRVCARIVRGADPDYALPGAIREKFEHFPLIGRHDKEQIRRGLARSLRLIDLELGYMYRDALFPSERPEVELEDDARTLDIGTLSSFLIEDDAGHNGEHTISVERIRSRHARRRLILATMAWVADISDEPEWIHEDIRFIGEHRRSMFGKELRALYVVGQQGSRAPGSPIRKQSVTVFLDPREAQARVRELGSRAYSARYMCREARVGSSTYYIYANARRKPLFSTLLKMLRHMDKAPDRILMDARGFLDVVVAVQDEDSKVIRATREHALTWAAHGVSELWDANSMYLEDALVKKRATHGGKDYWNVRNLGRVIRTHGGLTIGGRVEQQVMPIGDFLATQSVSEEHHDVYAWRRFRLDFLPKMFPHMDWGDEKSPRYKKGLQRMLRIVRAREDQFD